MSVSKALIGGTAYEIKSGSVLVGGTGYSIKKGRTLVGGTGYEVLVPGAQKSLESLAIGTSIYMNVNGARTEFIIVHKGMPSANYADVYSGADGVWVLMKDCYKKSSFGSSNSVYPGSLAGVLSSTSKVYSSLYQGLDSGVQSLIKPISLPISRYMSNTSDDSYSYSWYISTLTNNTVFILSSKELGIYGGTNTYIPDEGGALDYFKNASDAKRIAYLNGAAVNYWTRSPREEGNDIYNDHYITTTGSRSYAAYSQSYGVRPAFVLPYKALVDSNYDIVV